MIEDSWDDIIKEGWSGRPNWIMYHGRRLLNINRAGRMNQSIFDVWINHFWSICGGPTIGDNGAMINKRRGNCGGR